MSVFELLDPRLVEFLQRQGIVEPTEPQRKAIPSILSGKHLLLVAPTGIGKTEAAMLPILTVLAKETGPGIKCLYVTPLRALNRDLLKRLKEMGAIILVDTDGDVTLLVPWLEDLGVRGVLPLERQAGVDGMQLRRRYPKLRMVGHFDKMTMNRGEAAMRAEFERLVPLMKMGGFIPSVDHQTPPGVSLEEYGGYLRLLKEYMSAVHP